MVSSGDVVAVVTAFADLRVRAHDSHLPTCGLRAPPGRVRHRICMCTSRYNNAITCLRGVQALLAYGARD